MRRHQSSVVMAFVDTLTCGLSAFLMLWLALVAVPAPKTGTGVPNKELEITVEQPAGPNLAVRFRIDGRTVAPEQLDAATTGDVGMDDLTDGLRAYRITFAQRYRPNEGDELIVYLHDLDGMRPETDVTILAALTPGTREWKKTLNLRGAGPRVVVRLADLLEERIPDPWTVRKADRP